MIAVVGLGNYGPKYLLTRHNIGFLILDALQNSEGMPSFNQEKKALTSKGQIESERCLLIKPQTFMNLSGEALQPLMSFYKIEVDQLIVIQDDIDQEFGRIKVQKARGHGGHNGIRNIHQLLGTNDYVRLKFGVDRPNGKMNVADYVLQSFTNDEQDELRNQYLGIACDCICSFIKNGYDKTANLFNGQDHK